MRLPHLILVAEPGRLERQTLQFVRSFRANGGRFKKAPIWVYHEVRLGQAPLDPKIVEALESFDVSLRRPAIPNLHFPEYPLPNKTYALADAEEKLSEVILTWVDSDILCLREPLGLMMAESIRVAARPVNYRNIGNLYTDRLSSYWQQVYQFAELQPAQFEWSIKSLMGESIYPYFNTGVMQTRPCYAVFRHARKVFDEDTPVLVERIERDGRLSSLDRGWLFHFFEQALNSACLLRAIESPDQFHLLPLACNVPLEYCKKIRLNKPVQLLHYHEEPLELIVL